MTTTEIMALADAYAMTFHEVTSVETSKQARAALSTALEYVCRDAERLVWAMDCMGMANGHALGFTHHVLRVGGMGDIDDCRTYIDNAMKETK